MGNSLGVVLPKEVVNRLGTRDSQTLFLVEAPDGGYRLTPHDPAFEQKNGAGRSDHRPLSQRAARARPVSEPLWIDERDALALHDRLLALHGGAAGLRDGGLLQSGPGPATPDARLRRPRPTPSTWLRPTAGLVRNHPFIDGNKRVGFVVGILFLELNGYRFTANGRMPRKPSWRWRGTPRRAVTPGSCGPTARMPPRASSPSRTLEQEHPHRNDHRRQHRRFVDAGRTGQQQMPTLARLAAICSTRASRPISPVRCRMAGSPATPSICRLDNSVAVPTVPRQRGAQHGGAGRRSADQAASSSPLRRSVSSGFPELFDIAFVAFLEPILNPVGLGVVEVQPFPHGGALGFQLAQFGRSGQRLWPSNLVDAGGLRPGPVKNSHCSFRGNRWDVGLNPTVMGEEVVVSPPRKRWWRCRAART